MLGIIRRSFVVALPTAAATAGFSIRLLSTYFRPGPTAQQPLDIDQPYPEPTEDGYLTLSFYSFFPLPTATLPQLRDTMQQEWAKKLLILGRIYIWDHGINAQLSIPQPYIQDLRQWLETRPEFIGRIPRFNWAIEHRRAFKSLHVRVRPLVAAGQQSPVGLDTLSREPEYLSPEQWDEELKEQEEPLLIDMRNSYEYRIGRFEGAVCPGVDTFREEMTAVRELCQDDPSKPIYMYCTGGIRCSVAGAMLKREGFKNVKTLKGGVINYGRQIDPSRSRFRGKNFTFDKRLGEQVTSEILSHCDQCGSACDTFTNCANTSCNLLFIQCTSCADQHHRTCGDPECVDRSHMTHDQLIKSRMPPKWNYHMRVRPEKALKVN